MRTEITQHWYHQVYRLIASQGEWNDISSEMMMLASKTVAGALSERLSRGKGGTFFSDHSTGEVSLNELLNTFNVYTFN